MDPDEEYDPDEEEMGMFTLDDNLKYYLFVFLIVIVAYVTFVGIISVLFTRAGDRRKDKKHKTPKTMNMTHKITNPDIIYRKNL